MIFENNNWKKTSQNSNIPLYTSKDQPKLIHKPVLIIGGVHGDEPEGVWLCEKLLEHLRGVSSPTHQDWVLIPCLNPDGFKKRQRTNANGVDLNRNFPSSDWNPTAKELRYFPGPKPGSELETQAVIEAIDTFNPRLIIHCHSWKPSIIYTASTVPKEAEILSRASGYELQSDIGYPTPGSLGQYGYFQRSIPVICIEEKEGAQKEETWSRFKNAFESILNE